MKKLHLFLFLTFSILIGTSANTFAQAKQEPTSKIVIDAKGGIHNHLGTKLGYIDKDDIVRNAKGQKIYFIDKNGNVIDSNGKNLGKAQKNGNYYNLNGANIITVRDKNSEECEILDPAGHSLGTVHKNYKLHACAVHCYFLTTKNSERNKKD